MSSGITAARAKAVARYMVMPGIVPRLKDFSGTGFGYLAFLIASVYAAVRILPASHPYTNPANIGQFGIRQAVAAAANHVVISRRNIDQILVFGAVMAAIVILFVQFLGLIFLLFNGTAFAQDLASVGGFEGLFKTRHPDTDIAFRLMDYVFGIPDFFKSGVPTNTPFHVALHALFKFYNMAILAVAVLIFLYYVIVVVAETAQTGVPFGKRFSHVYAPLRLVAAVGLLVPLNYGFNGSQYIALGAARLGSGLATNGWIAFNKSLDNPMGVDKKTLIANVKAPDITSMVAFFTVVHACREAYKIQEQKDIYAFVRVGDGTSYGLLEDTDYKTAMLHQSDNKGTVAILGAIEVIFGIGNEKGSVDEYCGVFKVPVREPYTRVNKSLSGGGISGGETSEATTVTKAYYELTRMIWKDERIKALGERFAHSLTRMNYSNPTGGISAGIDSGGNVCHKADVLQDSGKCSRYTFKPPFAVPSQAKDNFQSALNNQINEVVKEKRENVDFKIETDVLHRGWGGAGIWYNKIAEANGSFLGAVFDVPMTSRYPKVMEDIKKEKLGQDSGSPSICKQFDPKFSKNKPYQAITGDGKTAYYSNVMGAAFAYWNCDSQTEDRKGLTGNVVLDAMNIIFGTQGLFDMLNNVPDDKLNLPVHPLAQMVAIGKGLVDSAIRNLAASTASAFGGGMVGALNQHLGESLQAVSGFFMGIAVIGLTAGFVLFYVLPFLPFIYFFFAVGSWVKTVFEAMVGAPLWALAHLRIDGDGFSGSSAAGGYFLMLEIMLRPILTVFGLIGGMAIFTALVAVLNELFKIVVLNTTGTNLSDPTGGADASTGSDMDIYRRAIVDQFFFTIVYAIIVYMMATTSFKLIDQVPNNIMRWMKTPAGSFGDSVPDATGKLTSYAAIGTRIVGGQVTGGINSLGGAAGGLVGGLIRKSIKGGKTNDAGAASTGETAKPSD
jgi:conjugal transfer/type IV secretion protein DotA/TraY